MAVESVKQPFPIFGDVDGNPLESGYIYIGEINLDPVTNPISVFWDAGLTIPAAQPIRTIGGYPSNNGTPGALFANAEYSITIKNKNLTLVSTAAEPTVEISVATSTKIGGVLSGGGISVSALGAVTIVNDSHTHDTQYYPKAETYSQTETDTLLDAKADNTNVIHKDNTDEIKTGSLTTGESLTITSWSFVSTAITINTATTHSMKVGDVIYVNGLIATTNIPNGKWTVLTVEDTDTITFTAASVPTGSPTVSGAIINYGELKTLGEYVLNKIILRTSIAASGTSIDFTEIPSWAKKITISLDGVSTNGATVPIVQLGSVLGVETTGYLGASQFSASSLNFTNGLGLFPNWSAAYISHGSVEINKIDENAFVSRSTIALSSIAAVGVSGSSKTLTESLDRVRITTVSGTDVFTAGLINIMYEG